jgi:Ca2+-binding EF-hand superfamily protein
MSTRRLLVAAVLVLASALCFAQIAKTASERFQRLDVNHDGVLSRYETDAEVVFAALDSDGDGSITPAELKPLLPEGMTDAEVLDRVRVADRDANDVLNEAELTRATEMRFEWLDENKDGNVDEQELASRFLVKMVH